ncbi:MAG: transglutaminase [Deltaproteobacteria bacterium]|nr:MAG: transglutaminase [Deltaproteobacteria bacterium]
MHEGQPGSSRRHARRASRRVFWTVFALLASAAALVVLHLQTLGFDMSFMVPDVVHDVTVLQTFDGTGEEVRLRVFLPETDPRQTVFDERNAWGDLSFTATADGANRVGEWRGDAAVGEHTVTYRFSVRARGIRYDIAPEIPLVAPHSDTAHAHELSPTDAIQSTAPEIVALAERLSPTSGRLVDYLHAVFDHVSGFGFRPFKGTTDALTALRLGEASCNGKARLFVALMRARGVPARLVGGVILTAGDKKTSHQWVEVLAGGHWIPMDPTNGHFAEIPHDYLTLYRGDEVLFRHTADIGYRYLFRIKRELVPRQSIEQNKAALGIWGFFAQIGMPLDLLKVVIMIPLGAVVVVIFRNVLGVRTFGTFLPVLIAASARHTGLVWGIIGFSSLILLASLVRRLTAKLELLHSPQLAVLLTVVIGAMLFGGSAAVDAGVVELGRISLFPVAITAITAERFTLMEVEDGAWKAWSTLFKTMVVVCFAYVTINSLSLQILMLAFPELLLVVIALDIWLGRWVGLRLSEWLRFGPLARTKEATA